MVYIYNGILLSHKKNKILPFAAKWMDLEIIILTEGSQRHAPYDITYTWILKMIQKELSYKTETDSQPWKTNLWLPKEKRRKE